MRFFIFVAAITLFTSSSIAGAADRQQLVDCKNAAHGFSKYLAEKTYFSGASCFVTTEGEIRLGLIPVSLDAWDSMGDYSYRKDIVQSQLAPAWVEHFTSVAKSGLVPPFLCVMRGRSCDPA